MKMRRSTYLAVLLLVLLPQVAHALLDPHDDSIGVYFDPEASSACRMVPFSLFDVYLIVANPTAAIDGFECTVSYAGMPASQYYVQEPDLGAGAVDSDPSRDGYAVTVPEPYPVSGGRVVLCRWQMFVFGSGGLDFFVGPGTTPTLPYDHPVLFVDGVPRAARTFTCETQMPVASVNGLCPTINTYPCYSAPFDVISVDVSVYGPGRTDVAHVATDYEASDGFDTGLDMPRPAPTGPGYLAVSIEHPDWPGGPRFATDKQAPFGYEDEYRAWTLLVETDLDGPIRIGRGFSFLIDDFRLRDLQTGQVRDLFPYGEDLLFWNDGTPISRRYQLISGPWSPASPVSLNPPPVAVPRLTASPNPFNPKTTIELYMPAAGAGHVKIFDIRGYLVCALHDGPLVRGQNAFVWEGRNDAGKDVASGVYFVSAQTEGYGLTRKLLVVK